MGLFGPSATEALYLDMLFESWNEVAELRGENVVFIRLDNQALEYYKVSLVIGNRIVVSAHGSRSHADSFRASHLDGKPVLAESNPIRVLTGEQVGLKRYAYLFEVAHRR